MRDRVIKERLVLLGMLGFTRSRVPVRKSAYKDSLSSGLIPRINTSYEKGARKEPWSIILLVLFNTGGTSLYNNLTLAVMA